MLTIILITLGCLVAVLAAAVSFRLWSSSRVRVRSADQAIAMAKAAYGRPDEPTPVRVERDQDFWIVRLGPDRQGQTHSYLVALWDKRAHPLVGEEHVEVSLQAPR